MKKCIDLPVAPEHECRANLVTKIGSNGTRPNFPYMACSKRRPRVAQIQRLLQGDF